MKMKTKPANSNAEMFLACWECKHGQAQNDLVDSKYAYIYGCSRLQQSDWDKGVATDASGTVYQRNCPLGRHTVGSKP